MLRFPQDRNRAAESEDYTASILAPLASFAHESSCLSNINPIPIYTIVKASNGFASLLKTDETKMTHSQNTKSSRCYKAFCSPMDPPVFAHFKE